MCGEYVVKSVIFISRFGRSAFSRVFAFDGVAKFVNYDDSDVDDLFVLLWDVVRLLMSVLMVMSVVFIVSFVVYVFE